jgi:hypothetical protein
MVGLTVGWEEGLDSSEMMEFLVGSEEVDWVAQLYMAAHHFKNAMDMLGRREYPTSEDAVAEWTTAFAEAVRAWGNAEPNRSPEWRMDRTMADINQQAYNPTYPQSKMPTHKRRDMLEDWGTALQWLGRETEGRAVFQIGHEEGIWANPYCRPQREYPIIDIGKGYFFPSTAFPVVQKLEANIAEMQRELAAHQQKHGGGVGIPDNRGGFNDGLWTQLNFIQNGVTRHEECKLFPKTCALITELPELFLKDGQTKLSRLVPGTNIWPHCGPVDSRLRIHCALSVPTGSNGTNDQATFWVGTEKRNWVEGECLVFQESCEHKVVVNADAAKDRIVLIADFANPFLESIEDYLNAFEPWPEGVSPEDRPVAQQDMTEDSIITLYTKSRTVAAAAMNELTKDEL